MAKKWEDMKLTVELVPKPLWGLSLYAKLSRAAWSALKKKVFAEEGKRCFICGYAGQRFYLHEFWDYDDKRRVQRLVSVHHLCDFCHKVKHIGRTLHTPDGERELEQQGLTREDIVAHFCAVNNCESSDFERYHDEVFKVWRERNRHKWSQDIPQEIITR